MQENTRTEPGFPEARSPSDGPYRQREWYDRLYAQENYFQYRGWIYNAYIRAVVRKAGLKSGAAVLDVGCGQGFFSRILGELGFRVCGLDLSSRGLKWAQSTSKSSRVGFIQADISQLPFRIGTFDCVFVRSLSAYNTETLRNDRKVTDRLCRLVKPGGIFLFLYNTNLGASRPSDGWRNHSLSDAASHFSSYPESRCFYTTRLETLLLGKMALNRISTRLNARLSRLAGIGGELVCMVRVGSR